MSMSWKTGLTPEQLSAASHDEGHALLLAGPGTGKTRVLTNRVAYLIEEKGVEPDDILVLTFTRAAANELRERIKRMIGDAAIDVTVSTFHSYALSTILKYGAGDRLPAPIRIADDWEERNIIQEDLKQILRLKDIYEVRKFFADLSADWELSAENPGDRLPNPSFMGVWNRHRLIFGYTLRAELVYQLKHALEEGAVDPEDFPKYVIVDEYQDLNPCDLAVVSLLEERGSELFVAGDDDQSIYGFRHADPGGIRRFCSDYDATLLQLETCHRYGSNIMNIANYVANQDPDRMKKNIKPAEGLPAGEVHILHFDNQEAEADGIAEIAQWLIRDKGMEPGDILVLIRSDRNKSFSNPIRQAFEKLDLPVAVASDPHAAVNTEDGRLILSILRLVHNVHDSLAWRTLLQIRKNNIGPKTIQRIYALAKDRGISFAEALDTFKAEDLINSNNLHLRIVREVEEISRKIEWASGVIYSVDLQTAINMIIDEMLSGSPQYLNIKRFFNDFLNTMSITGLGSLLASIGTSLGSREQAESVGLINIMTMHQAKGLTAKAVFIAAAEDEYIPGRYEGGRGEDDERRLLYVSLTRPREYLFITHSRRRTGQQQRTGRAVGSQRRRLTRFLSAGPISSTHGAEFMDEVREKITI